MAQTPRNSAAVVRYLRYRPGTTRHELAEAMGVAVATINPIVARLMDKGRLVERSVPNPAGVLGRPRNGLELAGPKDTAAVMLWSHGVLDMSVATYTGQVVARIRKDMEGHPSNDELVGQAKELLASVSKERGINHPGQLVLGVPAPYERGVGLAGVPSSDLSVQAPHSYARWFAADPKALISESLGIPVSVFNDANLGAVGETVSGAGVGEPSVIYLKLSDHGVGSGIVINGRIYEGSHGFAGEVAHLRVDNESTIVCSCGSRGCLESKLGRNLLEQLRTNYGPQVTYDDLLALAAEGAPGPVRVLRDAGRTIGRPLADLSTFLNPSAIIVDAGSDEATRIVNQGIEEQLDQSTPAFIRTTLKVTGSTLRSDAELLGAIEVARHRGLDGEHAN